MESSRVLSKWVVSLLFLIVFSAIPAQEPVRNIEAQYEGNIGAKRIGLTVILRGDSVVAPSHYFFNDLKDITLTGNLADGVLRLFGDDGSKFELGFLGNESEGKEKLDFENSIGLRGSWQRSRNTETTHLRILTEGEPREGLRYSFVTDKSDAEFEAMVQEWRTAALNDRRVVAAKYTRFPLRVNWSRKHFKFIRTAAELTAQWATIFTPAYLTQLRKDMAHDMLGGHEGLIMLGSGDAWFGPDGVEVLNVSP